MKLMRIQTPVRNATFMCELFSCKAVWLMIGIGIKSCRSGSQEKHSECPSIGTVRKHTCKPKSEVSNCFGKTVPFNSVVKLVKLSH
jgi:hypothetical protein